MSWRRSAELRQAAEAFRDAQDAVVVYGSEGMGLAESAALAQACANLLLATGHVGRANNGLLGVWPRANDQGAWKMGCNRNRICCLHCRLPTLCISPQPTRWAMTRDSRKPLAKINLSWCKISS